MLPILLNLKFVKIYTFGAFLVLAFFWGSFILWKLIRLTLYKEEEIFDGVFYSLLGTIILSRLFYIFLNFNKFGIDILKIILINGYPGLSLYGALIGAFLILYLYFFSKKIKFFEIIDYFIPPIFLALTFGKIGSFLSGSEVGTKTKSFLAIKYVGFDGLRHPTAFFEAVFFLLGFYIAYKILFEIRKEKYNKGLNFYFFIWYFSLIYFVFDKLKSSHLYLMRMSFNQSVSLILLLTSTVYFIYYFRNLFFSFFPGFINYLKTYGDKTFKKIYHGTKIKIRKRNSKS